MDFSQFYGLAGITIIRAITADIVKDYKITSAIAKIGIAMALGVVINVILALLLGNSLLSGVGVGFLTGLFSNFYNDIKADK
jgi:hypothetical protein